MTYTAKEDSIEDGRPIWFYEFKLGGTGSGSCLDTPVISVLKFVLRNGFDGDQGVVQEEVLTTFPSYLPASNRVFMYDASNESYVSDTEFTDTVPGFFSLPIHIPLEAGETYAFTGASFGSSGDPVSVTVETSNGRQYLCQMSGSTGGTYSVKRIDSRCLVATLAGVAWRYTSAAEAITVGGHTWEPAAISNDGQRQSGEPANDVTAIDAPNWIGPSQVYMTAAPSKAIQVSIFSKHEGDAELVTTYIGEITQINFPMPGRCKISCETLGASMQREGLRLGWQRSCPYSVYDPVTCKVDKGAWGTAFVVQSISEKVLIELATPRASGFYNNGFIEWNHPIRGIETIAIDAYSQLGTPNLGTILLMSPPGDLFVGATGTAYPGCNFTPESCTGFANYDNYGGVPDMPGNSPFDGNPFF